jgi:hypothetical protein
MLLNSGDVCRLLNIGEIALFRIIASGTVSPAEPGGRGRGRHRGFRPAQLLALAYDRDCRAAGWSPQSSRDGARFVANRTPGELLREFADGRTHVFPCPDAGECRLFEPAIRTDASRAMRIFLASFDLEKCCRRVVRRLEELAAAMPDYPPKPAADGGEDVEREYATACSRVEGEREQCRRFGAAAEELKGKPPMPERRTAPLPGFPRIHG